MLEFDSTRITFRTKGVVYYLAEVDIDDALVLAGIDLDKMTLIEQIQLMQRLLFGKARSERPAWLLRLTGKPSPEKALASLGAMAQVRLFKEWMGSLKGVGPGESSGSAV